MCWMFPLIRSRLRIFSRNVTKVMLCAHCIYSHGVHSDLSHYWFHSFWSLIKVVSACRLHCNNIPFSFTDSNEWAFCGQISSKYLTPHQTSSYSFISFCKYGLMVTCFNLMLKLTQRQPVGAPSSWFLYLLQIFSLFFEDFLAFWHGKMPMNHLGVFFLSCLVLKQEGMSLTFLFTKMKLYNLFH